MIVAIGHVLVFLILGVIYFMRISLLVMITICRWTLIFLVSEFEVVFVEGTSYIGAVFPGTPPTVDTLHAFLL